MTFRLRSFLARRANSPEPFLRKLHRLSVLSAEGAPVGLLRNSDLARFVNDTYAAVPDFYNPQHYQFSYEDELLPLLRDRNAGTKLLDLYCGQGREALIFAKAGYSVTGADALPSSIEHARNHARDSGVEANFCVANLDEWEPPEKDWDVVYTSLWMYSTIHDRERRISWLSRFAKWLRPSGLLVISTTPRTDERSSVLRLRIARIVAKLSLNPRIPELGDRVDRGLFWHDFTRPEAENEIAAAGLKIVDQIDIDQKVPCLFYILQRAA